MLNTNGFFDLCIQETFFSSESVDTHLRLLYDYGYRTIALNQSIDDGNIESKKKKKKGEPRETVDIVPMPYNQEKIKEKIAHLDLHNFQILSRLTISFSNQDFLHKITKSPNFRKYNLIAAGPISTQALSFTCNTFEADIFTFNPENKFSLRVNRKMYNQLIDRGYHFELLYSPAIADSTQRKHLIHAAHMFHSFGKSKNIFFSSGADNPFFIRNPYDVINLGFMFGLNTLQSKASILHYPRRVILNSVGRTHGKSVMFVENLNVNKTKTTVEITNQEDDELEDMEINQPKSKKTKL